MSHGKHKIKHMMHYFIKSFVISVILFVISALICSLGFDFIASMTEKFYRLDYDDTAKIAAVVMGIWKVLIIQFTLVPAIALFFIKKHIEKHHDDKEGGCSAEGCNCS